MKNVLFLFTLLFFVACEKQEMTTTDADQMDFRMTSSKVNLLGLDRVPIYPNDHDIRDLLKNPDDASDENMGHLLYNLSEAVKPLTTDYKFNSTILTIARKSKNNTASFEDLKKLAPNYYKQIDANLAPSTSIARIASQMVYLNPTGGKAENYKPGIHIPNLKQADANRQPLLSAQLEYTGKDERMEDFILCIYNNGESGFEGIWVGPHTAAVTTNPIFVIDNIQIYKKKGLTKPSGNTPSQNIQILDVKDSNEELAQRMDNDFDYKITKYKIAHRYDKSKKSEYSYKLVFFLQGGGTQANGSRNLIKRIHKDDINHLFTDNKSLGLTQYPFDLSAVGMITFEHDWWASNKTHVVSGVEIDIRTKYGSHWYQNFFWQYFGWGVSENTKGYIELDAGIACTSCPPGYGYDGANCHANIQPPPGYNPFIYGSSFYVQQNCSISTANACCPDDFGWDTANCHSGIEIPTGWQPFIWNNNFYVQPQCN